MRLIRRSRRPRRLWVGLLALFGMIMTGSVASGDRGGEPRLVSADDSRVVFELDLSGFALSPSAHLAGTERLDVPGFGTFSEPGAPRVPARDFLVALPPDGGYTLRYTVLQSRPLGRHRLEPVPFPELVRGEDDFVTTSQVFRIDDAVYGDSQSRLSVTAESVGHIRRQRVLAVQVLPLTYDPATGEAVLATSIRIEVSFARRSDGQDLLQGRGAPVRESAVWDRILSGALVNSQQARAWRFKNKRPSYSIEGVARAAAATAGPLVKLEVGKTGLHRVMAASAIAKGFPGGTPVSSLHIFKRNYDEGALVAAIIDQPYRVVEGPSGVGGVFDSDDYVIFYGVALREDAAQQDPYQKFSDDNVYWLGNSSGPQMAQKIVPTGFVSADTTTATFPATYRYEEDFFFMEETPTGLKDFVYYNSFLAGSYSAPFTLGAVPSNGTFELRAQFLGSNINTFIREIKIELVNGNGTTALPSAFVPRKNLETYSSGAISSGVLAQGLNTLRIKPSSERTVIEALLNWFTVSFDSPYRAVSNVLEFNTASLSGDTSLTVTGLGRKDVMLFDITDPLAPEECQLTDGHFVNAGGGFALSFRQSLASQKHFVVTPFDKIEEIAAESIIADEPSALIGNPMENGVDILVVSHADFLGEMQRWVDFRTAQGYRVLMADADDVYDEFNSGVPNPRAIKRFIKHYFEMGSASFVVLVGDASEDNKRVHAVESGINFVPTESFTEHVLGGGFDEDEVVTTDKWYVMLDFDFINEIPPNPGVIDFYPDLLIGRLPVGSQAEAKAVVDKILQYEQPSADEAWRRRMIRVADDNWSGGSTLCPQGSEVGFQTAEETAAVITEQSLAGGFDVVRFYLSDEISHPSNCVFITVQINQCRLNAVPKLINELNQGAALVSFQAHMNRHQVCHEFLFTSSIEQGQRDHLSLRNDGRPFIVFGFGCHLSDYAIHKELTRTTRSGANGDCLSEQLFFLPNRGAVASYGSSGYEYLSTNMNYTKILTEAFFVYPPTDTMVASDRAQARWILGELVTKAEIENLEKYKLGGPGSGAVGQAKRFHILGDPLLRIDAGAPRFEVTVDGDPFASGDPIITQSGKDSVNVRALISDEVAVEKLTLEIDGVDATDQLTVTPLVDQSLSAARRYEVTFTHAVRPEPYDIILRAHQAVDTTGTDYLMVAEFVFRVDLSVTFKVDGRSVGDGDFVPPSGLYEFDLRFPLAIGPSSIAVEIDDAPPGVPVDITNTSGEDSTAWLVSFTPQLSGGPHTIRISVGDTDFDFNVVVGAEMGVREVITYPNPFVNDTYFVYTNDVAISNGTIDIFTSSGKKVARLDVPAGSRGVGQNAVYWDGRTPNGDEIANGVYLFVFTVDQGGSESTFRGKLVHAK